MTSWILGMSTNLCSLSLAYLSFKYPSKSLSFFFQFFLFPFIIMVSVDYNLYIDQKVEFTCTPVLDLIISKSSPRLCLLFLFLHFVTLGQAYETYDYFSHLTYQLLSLKTKINN